VNTDVIDAAVRSDRGASEMDTHQYSAAGGLLEPACRATVTGLLERDTVY